jgi:TRAP transporter TAXI family solute receptor
MRRIVLLALLVILTACNPQQMAERSGSKKRLSIATGGTGGVYYPYGGGVAKVITEHIPNVEATAEVTAASVDNLKFIRDRKADIAFTTADVLADGINGTGAFKDTRLPIRAIANLYKNYTHVITLAASPIKTIRDLKGKVVSIGSPGSGTQVTALRVLKAFGLDPDSDIKSQSLGVSESADALKDGKIDAFFWSGGVPAASVLDLSHTAGIKIRVVPNDSALSALQDTYGKELYLQGIVPKSVYAGMDGDVGVISIPNLLVVHADMDANLVYEITKALFENKAKIVAIHPEAANLSLATAVVGSPAQFHPGAIRYYEEQRAWPK